MYKNHYAARIDSAYFQKGFTLIELHVYLAVTAGAALLLCQVALMYYKLYDTTVLRAQKSVLILAAHRQINETFQRAVMYQKKNALFTSEGFSPGTVLSGTRLLSGFSQRKMVLLEGVDRFDCTTDIRNKNLYGVTFICTSGGDTVTWYQASFMKAFSCSCSL